MGGYRGHTMGILIRRTFILLSLLAMILSTIMASACYGLHSVTDPDSKTPGYKLFTGRTGGVRVSFEYPNTWRRISADGLVYLVSQDSYVTVCSVANKSEGGNYADAGELTQHWLDSWSTAPEFRVLSRGKAQLGQAEGEEVMYSRRFQGSDPHAPLVPIELGEIAVTRTLDVDYKGRIYVIDLLAAVDRFETVKGDFEHLIATFRFLE